MQFDDIIKNLPALLGAVLTAILFIQSGLDKVLDWKGNIGWLTGHFEKTFMGGFVPLLLAQITVIELAAGLTAAAGIVYFLMTGSMVVVFASAVIAAVGLVALFFGQRIAKDYPGAAVLIPYFLLMTAIMYLTNPYAKP